MPVNSTNAGWEALSALVSDPPPNAAGHPGKRKALIRDLEGVAGCMDAKCGAPSFFWPNFIRRNHKNENEGSKWLDHGEDDRGEQHQYRQLVEPAKPDV